MNPYIAYAEQLKAKEAQPNMNPYVAYANQLQASSPWRSMSSVAESAPPMQEKITPVTQATQFAPTPPPIPQMAQFDPNQALLSQLEKKYQESINARMQDIGNRASLTQGMMQTYEPQVDLSPLLAYAQSKTGTNLTAGYQRPEQPMERVSKVLALQQGLEQQRRGITQDEIAMLKSKIGAGSGGLTPKESQDIRIQLSKSDQYKNLDALSKMKDAAQKYRNLVETHGIQVVGEKARELDSAYADLKIKYKEAANLGALTGPDVALLEQAISPAVGFKAYAGQPVTAGVKGITASIDNMLGTVNSDARKNLASLKSTFTVGGEGQISEMAKRFEEAPAQAKSKKGASGVELSKKYGITPEQAKEMLKGM